MPRLLVWIEPSTAEELVKLAQAERRHPKDQAGLILEKALSRGTEKAPKRGQGQEAHDVSSN